MIFFTGDTHSNFERFSSKAFPEQLDMTKDDYVIICGDFGGIWNLDPDNKEENYWLDWLDGKNFTTLFIDGNHENYDRLNMMPEEMWHGGRVHKIRPSIIHLMRGQIFDIDGLTFFTFGGAKSHDIRDGILELDDPEFKKKKNKLEKSGSYYRIDHVSWWKEELPSPSEMREGLAALKTVEWDVDIILTHCAPTTVVLFLEDGFVG